MIDEMLLFNRHDEINLDALKVIKEKKRYKMDKIKKHFNFQTLEDPIMSPSAEMTKFMTKYLTGTIQFVHIISILRKFKKNLDDTDINVEYYECGHLCTVPHLPMVRVTKVIRGWRLANFYYLRMTFDLVKVDKSFMMIGNGKMMMSWGTCETGKGCLNSHLLRSGPDHLVSITACWFYEIKS